VATILLTGHGAGYPRLGRGYGQPGITVKGIVGLELKARGFDVDLEIYQDNDTYDVCGGIVATNPATSTTMNVRVSDDGVILWEYDHETAGSVTSAARYPELADSIVTMAARVIAMYPAVPGDSP